MSDPLKAEIAQIYRTADEQGRRLTADENSRVADLLVQCEHQALGKALGADSYKAAQFDGYGGGGPGDVFVKSAEYKRFRGADSRGQSWSTGPVEVAPYAPALQMKGTLLESTAGGPGGGLVPPGYQPGIVSKLFEPLSVSQLFGSSQTPSSQMRYVVEGTATNAAAGVAEGAAKPESTLHYSETTEAIRKIATVLPISEELWEDAPSIQAYLNERLSLFVRIEEERQLLRGAGGGSNELVGIIGRSGVNTYNTGADDNVTGLAKVIANTRGSANVMPDAVVMHPTNWLNTRLLRDGAGGTAGNFYGAGPFGASGNNAGGAALFGQALWDMPVALSTVVGLGTALVGNFGQSAHIWRRGGLSVDASNSHSDFYVKNLLMLRAEERIGLGVYRPVSFTTVSGLD
jgi:HK97 family phage major capsid protein